MVPWPAFLSFPFSLPSLPSISLPANIQRRFLSYVLKRALGRFIRSGLDVDKIQSQIGEGKVEIEGLEVDEDEINSLIPSSVPLSLRAGVLDRVTARIPFPNLWSAPLTLSLDSLTLDFDLLPSSAPSPKGKAPETPFRPFTQTRRSPTSPSVDLAASVTTAADEFLHDELDAYEEAELDRSIRQSLILSRSDPFVEGDVPGAFPTPASPTEESEPLPATVESTTVLAGLVERILGRLECNVTNVRIRLHHKGKDGDRVLELRVGRVSYADESGVQDPSAGSTTSTRVVRIAEVGIFLIPVSNTQPTPFASSHATTSRSSSVSSASSSASTESDDNAEMYMSQAVADLRQSTISDIASDASVYHSAIGDDLETPAESAGPDAEPGSRTPTPTGDRDRTRADPGTMLFSLGSEDVVMRMRTTRPIIDANSTGSASPPTAKSTMLPSLAFDITVGAISVLLLPSHISNLLDMSRAFSHNVSSDPSPTPEVQDVNQPKLDARLRIKGVFVTTIYEMAAERSTAYQSSLTNYWARPSSYYIPAGHLKFKLDSIDVGYSAAGYVRQPVPARGSTRPLARRASTTHSIRFGPKPPVVSLRVQDASLFEYIATDTTPASSTDVDDAIPGGAYPVFIFDAGLPKQYEAAQSGPGGKQAYGPTRSTFPEFDQIDWRNSGLQKKSGGAEKSWRVRPKARGAMKAVAPVDGDSVPVLELSKELSPTSAAILTLQPIHVFLDLSMVERLLPVLRFISPSIHATRSDKDATPHHSPARSHHQLPTQYVLDDLDAQASSVATLQPASSGDLLVVRCPLVRLDIRCPAPVNRRGSWGDGAHLRSGIVTLDIHALHAEAKRPSRPTGTGRVSFSRGTAEPKATVGWNKMLLFFARVPEKRASAFLVIGPLKPDPTDTDVLLPIVEVRSATNPSSLIKTSTITVRVPSVQAKIRQRTIEGLQFFADDITHWLDGAFGDGSAPKPRDDLKMIGSRFFGSKASSSASSSGEEEDEDDMAAATVLRLFITETEVDLHVPRREAVPDQPEERVLSLKASDLDVKIESNITGRQETSLTLAVLDADFADRTDPTSLARILSRTTPLSLAANNAPIVHLRFTSLTHPQSGFKETGIKLALASCTAFVTKDQSWAKDLARFAKTPEGVFEDVVPSEITRVGVSLHDLTVHLRPPNIGGAVVLVFASLETKTDLESGADSRALELGLGNLAVLAVDDMSVLSELQGGQVGSAEAFKRAGYAPLAEVLVMDLQVMQDNTGDEELLVDVLQAQIRLTACADSLATAGALAGDIGSMFTPPKSHDVETEEVRSPAALEHSVNVFASIDEHAFNQIPDIAAGADLIEDDLPTNLDYLDTTTRPRHQTSTDRSTGESLRAWQATDESAHNEGGDTVKILQSEFEVVDDYWESLPTINAGYTDETRIGKTRVRVHDASLAIYLHEGYDWIRTRKVIEEEMKAVRKRLERIRQLLASGQKADETFDQATTGSMLFNSVYIGLDQNREGLDDTAALLAAIDEELEDMAGETEMNTQSSWQTLPGAPFQSGSAPTERPKRTRLHGRRLTRSKRAQIEINLSGIKCDFDAYSPEDDVASRVHATVQSLEILDHIKTSTWKKFLTEMKADARGNMRETDADMVRIELVAVRPSLPSPAEESRLRAKILPLRLHVDQDALDFLKRFFNFSLPVPSEGVPATPSKKAASSQPFFQHVEIYPIELKLDYKPKRVDFAALREGKTMELMNFFHFDGAEMTLRHITLSGIAGWDRLSTTLQDTWTPDVKANQIADIISGVSPIRSLVNVGSGVADLILLPIEQYRKDGRVARGVQRGTNSFVRSTAMEMMKLGARLATGTQVVLEKAEGVFGGTSAGSVEAAVLPGLAGDEEVEVDAEVLSRYANQPASTREGLQEGYKAMSRNINSAAQTILAVPMEVYERSGDDGPLRAVVRAVPIAVLKPMIGASEAVSKTLLGMRNSLDPQGRKELVDKYK